MSHAALAPPHALLRPAALVRLAMASLAVYLTACSELPEEPELFAGSRLASSVAGAAFTDDFSFFDESRWVRSSHTLGRGPLLPANVESGSGFVSLMTRSEDFSGAEIMSRELYGAGRFTIHARCAVPDGAICAFFLYEIGVGNRADEIDIEIIPSSGQIWFTTWKRGRRVNTSSHALTYDPAAAYHSYAFERTATEIRFFVDGVERHRYANRKRLPDALMPVFANAWWPTWITPGTGSGGWEIDSIRVD